MSKFTRGAHRFERQMQSNGFGRFVGRLTEGAAMAHMADMFSPGKISHVSTSDINTLGDDFDPFRAISDEKSMSNEASALKEQEAERANETQTQSLSSDIDAAYGLDQGGEQGLEANLRSWMGDLNQRLGRSAFVTFGSERDTAENNVKQLSQILADVQTANAVRGGNVQKAKMAIDTMGGQAAVGAKRSATRDLDSRLASQVTRENAAAFSRGVSGSSFDKAAQAKNVADYTLGRSNIANELATSDQGFRDTLDAQRRTLQDRARVAGAAAINPTAILTDQQSAASGAYQNLGNRALGNLLATGSDLVANDQVQRAQGNLGFRGLTGSAPFTASRASGGSISRS